MPILTKILKGLKISTIGCVRGKREKYFALFINQMEMKKRENSKVLPSRSTIISVKPKYKRAFKYAHEEKNHEMKLLIEIRRNSFSNL